MDFDERIAERLSGLLQACGYQVAKISVETNNGRDCAKVDYLAGAPRLIDITMDGALMACSDIIKAVGHFG